MAGKRKSQRELGDSWADVSSEDEASDGASEGGESVEIQEVDDETQHPAQSVEVANGEAATSHSNPRRSMRTSRQSLEAQSQMKSPQTPTSTRRSPRLESPSNSIEPGFIMPSMLASGSVKGTPAKASPLTSSVRARRGRPLAASRMTPSRVIQRTPPKKPWPKAKSKKVHARQGSPLTALWSQFIRPILGYALGVMAHAFVYLKPLLGFLLAVFVVVFSAKYAFKNSLQALNILPDISKIVPSPCSVPILNLLPMCGNSFAPGATPEFDDLMKVQSSFEEILESTAHGAVLPIEMKKSEASVRDLKYVVTYSNLPSKNELVFEFQGFIEVARQAGSDLTRFNSRVGSAVDSIISTNKHTMQVIDGVIETDASRGALSRWLWGEQLTQEHLLNQYLQHTSQVEERIKRLIDEAQFLLKILDDLDGRLDVIHDIIVRDGVSVKGSRDELFEQLWTKLGGNRNSVAKLDNQLNLLKSVNTYRKAAWTHVTSTLLKLQSISAGLEDLRERVALPETIGIEYIPLSQHIETIQMGVDRLEEVRKNSRAIEGQELKRLVQDGQARVAKDRMVDGKPIFSV